MIAIVIMNSTTMESVSIILNSAIGFDVIILGASSTASFYDIRRSIFSEYLLYSSL